MDERELRQLVRQAVVRHVGAPAGLIAAAPSSHQVSGPQMHPSQVLYAGLVNVSDACVIEPAVACDHCGYCKSHGH